MTCRARPSSALLWLGSSSTALSSNSRRWGVGSQVRGLQRLAVGRVPVRASRCAQHFPFRSASPRQHHLSPSLMSSRRGESRSVHVSGSPPGHALGPQPPPPPGARAEGAGAGAALRYETPLWLAVASGREGHRRLRTPVIDMTKVKRPRVGSGSEGRTIIHDLGAVLADIDPKTEVLHIAGDVPTNDEWEQLGHYFTHLRFLKVATGWEEEWIDDKFPLGWPLELLVIADAAGQRVTTPVILDGRVPHLVLCFTSGLRFEGPSNEELMKDAEPIGFIPRKKPSTAPLEEAAVTAPQSDDLQGVREKGTGAPEDVLVPASAPTENQGDVKETDEFIKITSIPYEWSKWLYAKYANKRLVFSTTAPGEEEKLEEEARESRLATSSANANPTTTSTTTKIKTKTLQILGNDALQMLSYLALCRMPLLGSLERLAVHSCEHDLTHVPATLPLAFPLVMHRLRHLRLTLGGDTVAKLREAAAAEEKQEGRVGQEEEQGERQNRPHRPHRPHRRSFLRDLVPPHVETLCFRGPVSMALSGDVDDFVAALRGGVGGASRGGAGDGIEEEGKEKETDEKEEAEVFLPGLKRISFVLDLPGEHGGEAEGAGEPSLDQLRAAKAACARVRDAAAARGVVVEDFSEPWVEVHPRLFREVDRRWAELDLEEAA